MILADRVRWHFTRSDRAGVRAGVLLETAQT